MKRLTVDDQTYVTKVFARIPVQAKRGLSLEAECQRLIERADIQNTTYVIDLIIDAAGTEGVVIFIGPFVDVADLLDVYHGEKRPYHLVSVRS